MVPDEDEADDAVVFGSYVEDLLGDLLVGEVFEAVGEAAAYWVGLFSFFGVLLEHELETELGVPQKVGLEEH